MSLAPLFEAPLAIQIHAVGRVWALLMLIAATASIFINEIRLIGPFSPIHLFTIITYVGLAHGIVAIRRGDVRTHRATMQSLYFLALLLAGAFTLLPGRRIHDALFGATSGWVPSLIAISLVLTATMAIYIRLRRHPLAY